MVAHTATSNHGSVSATELCFVADSDGLARYGRTRASEEGPWRVPLSSYLFEMKVWVSRARLLKIILCSPEKD